MKLYDENRPIENGRPFWLSRRSYIAPFELVVLPGGLLHVGIFLPVKDKGTNGFIRYQTKRTAAELAVILEEFTEDPEGVVTVLFDDHPYKPDVESRRVITKPATARKERVLL